VSDQAPEHDSLLGGMVRPPVRCDGGGRMFRRLAILTVALFAPLVAVPAALASGTDLSAALINGNYGSGSGQLAVNWMNNASTTFNGTVHVSLTVPSSVTLEGPDYLGTCSSYNTTDGCQSVNYSSSAGQLTLSWTGIITPGQAFYTKVVYQAAAQVGSLPQGQLVETISDTDPTDTDGADKTSILQAGTGTQQSQTISFTSTPPASPTVGGTYNVAATATSGLPVSFSIDSTSTAGACSVSGATVSFTGPGACVIDADQAGNATYAPAPRVTQTVPGIAPTGNLAGPSPPATQDLGRVGAGIAATRRAAAPPRATLRCRRARSVRGTSGSDGGSRSRAPRRPVGRWRRPGSQRCSDPDGCVGTAAPARRRGG